LRKISHNLWWFQTFFAFAAEKTKIIEDGEMADRLTNYPNKSLFIWFFTPFVLSLH
jgi:hypothetical protein